MLIGVSMAKPLTHSMLSKKRVPSNFVSTDFPSIQKKQCLQSWWSGVLLSLIVFVVLSSSVIVIGHGLGILKLTEGVIDLYLKVCFGQTVGLAAYPLRYLFGPNNGKDTKEGKR
jgi:hypothetical protein